MVFIVVISCLISRLCEDHKRAQRLANLVNMHGGRTFRADYHGEFSTNFVYVRIAAGSGIHSKDVVERLERVTETEAREMLGGTEEKSISPMRKQKKIQKGNRNKRS